MNWNIETTAIYHELESYYISVNSLSLRTRYQLILKFTHNLLCIYRYIYCIMVSFCQHISVTIYVLFIFSISYIDA